MVLLFFYLIGIIEHSIPGMKWKGSYTTNNKHIAITLTAPFCALLYLDHG